MDINALCSEIRKLTNVADATQASRALRETFARLQYDVAETLKLGTRVSFDAKRRGVIVGVVTSIKGKTVHVREDGRGVDWRVSPTLLRILPAAGVERLPQALPGFLGEVV
jgi:hypothetical protein